MLTNERIVKLKDESIARSKLPRTSPCNTNYSIAFFDIYKELPLWERQARSFVYTLMNEPMHVHPNETLAGQIYQALPGSGCPPLGGAEGYEQWAEYAAYPVGAKRVAERLPENKDIARFFHDGACPGHITWDWSMILNEGVSGMIKRVENLDANPVDEKAHEFYGGVKIVLEGLIEWTKAYVLLLNERAEQETDQSHKAELLEMARICSKVPEQPAANFREAVQSFLLQYLAVMFENPFGGNGVGRLDYYLWPYLERDLADGTTDMETARDIIAELFIKLDERIRWADGWVEAIVVGGHKPDGSLSINPLSYMMVEVIMELNQTHPSVYIRLPKDAPQDFVELSADYLVKSDNRGQVYGDEAVTKALVNDATAIEDARHWAAGGCMEVSVQGASGDLLFSFAHNCSRTLELVLNGGKLIMGGEQAVEGLQTLPEYTSFDELVNTFESEFRRELDILVRRIGIYEESFSEFRPSFLVSSMVHDCLERGRNLLGGGSRYCNFGGSCVGIPNVADSLYVIKKAVFEDRRYTGTEILEAIKADFVGYEDMRAYLSRLPKYGSGNPEAVKLVDWVLATFTDVIKNARTPAGGHGVPIILGFVWVVEFGLQTGATPDGRRAGEPLAHGLSPQCGAAKDGITSAIYDATSLDLSGVPGGASMMWDLDKTWASRDVLVPILETYVDRGGHIFQGNVVDIDVLTDALEHPDKHEDLIVRVGGYSARFTTLSKQTQQEIIERRKYTA